jgi:glycerol uptake facilitator-like aquaporin
MTPFIAEIIGTMLMILLGNGVVANVVLTELRETIQDGLLLQQDGHLPFYCSH